MSGHGSSANVTAPPASPPSSGAIRPRRSEKRPGERADDRLQRRGQQPRRADRRRARAELVSRSGPSTLERAEQQPGDRDQRSAGADAAVAQRARPARATSCRASGSARRASASSRPSAPRPTAPTRAEHRGLSRSRRRRRRSPARAARRRSPRPSPSRSARRAARAAPPAASQAIAPAHDAAPPTPCTKRATSSTTMLSANAKPMLESVISPSPRSTVGFTPDPRGHPAARQPAHERPGRIGRGQQPGAGLRQVVLVGQVGQQRRDRGVERRVDEDDERGEEEQAAHAAPQRC